MKYFHNLLIMNQTENNIFEFNSEKEEDNSMQLKSIYIHYPNNELKQIYTQRFQEKK